MYTCLSCVFLVQIIFYLVNETSGQNSEMYLGCYEDQLLDRLMPDHQRNFHGNLTPEICIDYCKGKGFAYAGTQYSYECFCSKTKPPDSKKASQNDCRTKCAGDESKTCGGDLRLAIYTTGIPPSTEGGGEVSSFIGCFKDSEKNRFFPEYRQDIPSFLTNIVCLKLCTFLAYQYGGTENGRECYCGNRKPSYKDYAQDDECSTKCEGDVNQVCGGDWRISVFKTRLSDPTESLDAGNYIGCYTDQADPRALDGYKEEFNDLTPFKCTGLCYSKGFLYAGTRNSDECFCGNNPPSPSSKVEESECNKPCPGHSSEICGGDYRNSVRETGVPGVSVNFPRKPKPKPTTERSKGPCAATETVVSGKSSVCKGDVIFEDKFDSALGNNWQHVVMIPDDTEYEKAVFLANSSNSFTTNGRLVIKPTIFADEFVQTGFLRLKGCTGKPGTSQCELQASGYFILPPVASARLHTRDSFSFRYGIIEIRARLPLGDWLVPELWLQPKRMNYGLGYASGQMRIAVTRGNNDFKCNGEDYGFTKLESGVVMGTFNNLKTLSQTVRIKRNWYNEFHNYTVIWTSDGISFKIDNGPAEKIVLDGRNLCNVIGFENRECSRWSAGSRIAPFDEEFYISLGLSVASNRDFPDGCIPKPWRNSDPKAMLNFWRDKGNWKATWTEESSALYVEHVRVTAL